MARNKKIVRVTYTEVRIVQRLLQAGWSYREIEYNFNISSTVIHRIANGRLKIKKVPKRCPTCGHLYEGEYCYACYIKSLPPELFNQKKVKKQEPIRENPCILGLELRPRERKRYEIVRKKKLEQIAKQIKETEGYIIFDRPVMQMPEPVFQSNRHDS